MNQGTKQLLFAILRSAVCGNELTDSEKELFETASISELFKLAKHHDVAHIVAVAIKKAHIELSDEISALFKKEQALVLYRYLQLTNEAKALYAALDAAEVPYMVLKGSEIRKHYPSPEMRVSSDIDILVAPEDLDKTLQVLQNELEYTLGIKTAYDVSTFSLANVHVEVHYKLTSEDERYDAALADVRKTSLPDGDSKYRRVMSPELLLAYNVMHTAKHFHNGGCGIRFLMDLFVLENKLQYDRSEVDKILAKCNLTKFYEEIHRLTSVCFADGEHNDLTVKMLDYILGSGLYGNIENKVAVFQSESGGRLKYALMRIFPKRSTLMLTYPRLEKCALLYPYYMVKRWFRILFTRRKEALTELKNNATLDEKRISHLRTMLDELNL